MDRRQLIIETVLNEITNITTGSDFNNTVLEENVYRKYKPLTQLNPEIGKPIVLIAVRDDENNKPRVIGTDETGDTKYVGRVNSIGNYVFELIKELKIQIGGIILSESDAGDDGLLSIESEKFRKDLEDFFHCKKAIKSSINDIDGIRFSYIKKSKPYPDDTIHKGIVYMELLIEYYDNIEELNDAAPSAPTISSPSNGSTVTTTQPNIVWNSVASASFYHLQIASDSSFNTIVIEQNYINDYAYTINSTDALSNTTYYVKVRAYNTVGYSSWSSTVSFTVNTAAAIVAKDWNEITGSNGWWNSYSSTGVIISSGVSALLDQIGSRNLTQTTSTRRPSLSGAAYGSVSSIYFNPTFASESDCLSYNDTGSAFKWGNSTTGSLILVMMSDGTNFDLNSGYFCPIARSNTSFGSEVALIRGSAAGPAGYCFGYPFPSTDYAIVPIGLNRPQHIIITHSSSASILYLNGTKIGQLTKVITNFTTETNTKFVLGAYYEPAVNYGSGRYTGHVFEVGHNTTALTEAQVSASYEKFKDRFNL